MANSNIVIGGCRIPVTNNIADNLAEIKKAIDWAAENGVNLMATPECALSGYLWAPKDTEDPRVIELNDAIQEITSYSKDKSVDLILGTAWYDAENRWTNMQAFIIDGKCLHTHRKNVLFQKEGELYYPGTPPTVFEYKGVRIAGLICNDAWANPILWPGHSGMLLGTLKNENVHFVFLSAFVPKESGPNDIFYRWHQSQIEMFSAFGIWNTVICDTTTNVDGSTYDGVPVSPVGICDYGANWLKGSDTGPAYFKSEFASDLKISL